MHTMTMSSRLSNRDNSHCVLFSTAGPAVLLILLVVSGEVSAAVTSLGGGETTSTTIQCYECEWDHQTGCKTGAKVNNNHLRPNCTVCYKNVVQYVQGQAAASGTRRCLSADDEMLGYRGRSECWVVQGSLHCYCMENKCNTAPSMSTLTYSTLIVLTISVILSISLKLQGG